MSTETQALPASEVQVEGVAAPAAGEDQGTAPDPASEDQQPAAERTFTQSELDAIVQKRVAKAQAKAARQMEQTYRDTLERIAPRGAQTEAEDTSLDRSNFKSDAEWIDAKVEARLAERENRAREESQQQARAAQAQKIEAVYAKAEAIPGFDRDEFDSLPLTKAVAEAIVESDIAPKLMAHLLATPTLVQRLHSLPPARQAAEMGRVEERLLAVSKVSQAAEPFETVGRSRSPTGDLQNASVSEYERMRRKQGARWAR